MLWMVQGFQRAILLEDELTQSDIWFSQPWADVNM